jgi:hypothetical protein
VKPEIVHATLLPAIKILFPDRPELFTPQAQAMLIAIGLQESGFLHRQQLTGGIREWWKSITGPAAGYWQHERIGVRGVLEHRITGPMLRRALDQMGYPADAETIWSAIRYDNVLAVVVARLTLYQFPGPLPGIGMHHEGWRQYLATWRPGKPHMGKWQDCYDRAWRIVLDHMAENGGVLEVAG